jgi:preprotein translocase subunit SecF
VVATVQELSRTNLTGVTTLAVLGSILAFGGDVPRNFSFAMLLGVVIGTYSSIFLAAPLLGYLGIRRYMDDQAEALGPGRAPDEDGARGSPKRVEHW